jgi:hypothetical protein
MYEPTGGDKYSSGGIDLLKIKGRTLPIGIRSWRRHTLTVGATCVPVRSSTH